MNIHVPSASVLPEDYRNAVLVGRVFDPVQGGPAVVIVRGDELIDITHLEPTVSMLLEREDLPGLLANAESERTWSLAEVLDATLGQDYGRVHLLAPVDLQVIKAAGVTFVQSMLERVIEERAAGDPGRAQTIRAQLDEVIGTAIGNVRPGTPEAAAVKEILIREGLWSQYLEVGIGPDPEIFTKAPVLSAVGTGARIGVLARSTWNNPEPELALAVTSTGKPVGAMLANDVNLRDFEGRSALLLTEAKDNNASCALGPFIRIFDDSFSLHTARSLDIELRVAGAGDEFEMNGTSSMSAISRDLLDLINHAWGSHHQYPDGFVLLTGTLFAPTQDRGEAGAGFTHHEGDTVTISSPRLGSLINTVTSSEAAPDWVFGISALMRNLAGRGLLTTVQEATV